MGSRLWQLVEAVDHSLFTFTWATSVSGFGIYMALLQWLRYVETKATVRREVLLLKTNSG